MPTKTTKVIISTIAMYMVWGSVKYVTGDSEMAQTAVIVFIGSAVLSNQIEEDDAD